MLSDLQALKLTRYFAVYDIDDDGLIESSDFERIVENVRILHGVSEHGDEKLGALYQELWTRISSSVDGDGDGAIDLDEWLAFWQITLERDNAEQREAQGITARLFTLFDLDEDGRIGLDEFRDFYGVFGLPGHLAEAVFAALDTDNDGSLTRLEVLEAATEFLRSDDVEAPGNVLFGPYGA